jgi:acetylglutamate kinase
MPTIGRALLGTTTVLKLGGELLDGADLLRAAAASIGELARETRLVVVHGGGRTIDAELRARGLEPKFVDGLRVTDASTLEAVVAVLAGRTNTALVAALVAAGLDAVGLTGADAAIGRSRRATGFVSTQGEAVDLGLVGEPDGGPVTLLQDLTVLGYVPVVASLGITSVGELLNVNADTMAATLAAALGARRLVIAGSTPGVLDEAGRTIETLSLEQVDGMVRDGHAHSGMVAKLAACASALAHGVEEVVIADGRGPVDWSRPAGTRIFGSRAAAGSERKERA